MITWKSKICKGMDVVETIIFVRQTTNSEGNVITANAVYVCGDDEQKPRSEWTQEQIDSIGDKLVADLDSEIERIIGAK